MIYKTKGEAIEIASPKDVIMSIEKVRDFFRAMGRENEIMEFDVSSATVELAAQALGTEPAYIAKSLTFNVNDKAVMIITAGDVKIDNSKYKSFFGVKAKMLTPDEVIEKIGHAVGGVCPFAINDGVCVYSDVSLKRFEYVYPACGSSNSAIKMTPQELFDLSQSKEWIDVSKPKEQ